MRQKKEKGFDNDIEYSRRGQGNRASFSFRTVKLIAAAADLPALFLAKRTRYPLPWARISDLPERGAPGLGRSLVHHGLGILAKPISISEACGLFLSLCPNVVRKASEKTL